MGAAQTRPPTSEEFRLSPEYFPPRGAAYNFVLGRSPAVCAVLTRSPMPALDPRPVATPRTRRLRMAAVPAIVWSVIAMLAFFLLVAAARRTP